jgi:nitrate/nitrite-specific signal transduction histidine kinase
MKKHGSLRRKIITWSFIPTVLVLVAVVLVNFQAYRSVTEELVVQRNRELVRLNAGQLSRDLDELGVYLDTQTRDWMAGNVDRFGPTSVTDPRSSLLNTFDKGIVLLSWDGKVIGSLPEGAFPIGQNWSDYPVYYQVMQSYRPKTAVSDVMVLPEEGGQAVALATPILDANARLEMISIGLLGLSPGENGLAEIIDRLRLEGRGSAYLVDGNGRVIYHYHPDQVGASYWDRDIVRQVVSGKVGSLRTLDQDQIDVVASYAPVLGTRWGLVSQEEWSLLTASSDEYMRFLLALLMVGIIAPALVVTMGVRRITKPIADLTEAAKEVSGGNFERQIQAATGDEIEELAEQFNRMSLQLQESYRNLEQRVGDRTRELQTLNTIASVVSRSLDLDDILISALEKVAEAMDMEAGAILIRQDSDALALMAHLGLSKEFTASVTHLEPGEGAAGEAARSSKPVVKNVGDYSPGSLRQAIEREGLQLVVSVPLISKGRTMGAMNLCSRSTRLITTEELEMLASIGSQVGVAVENAHLYLEAEQSAAAAERNRLARELHDAVTQTLFSASLIAEVLPLMWERKPDEGRRRLEELRQLNRGALAEMRTLLLELRPSALLEAELGELFHHLAEAFNGRVRVPVEYIFDGECNPPAEVKVGLYRIAQEALNNTAKHAFAEHVSLEIYCRPDCIQMFIRDDGQGFDPSRIPPEHLGVGIMKERAEAIQAELDISSAIGEGTEVAIKWSLGNYPGNKVSKRTGQMTR